MPMLTVGVYVPFFRPVCLHFELTLFSFSLHSVACCLLESCGRYLYRLPHTNPKLTQTMETMIRLSKAKVCITNCSIGLIHD